MMGFGGGDMQAGWSHTCQAFVRHEEDRPGDHDFLPLSIMEHGGAQEFCFRPWASNLFLKVYVSK